MTHTHCTICGTDWNPDTGVVVGHPMEFALCGECFDGGFEALLRRHNAPVARPTDEPCLVHWDEGGTRIGVPVPSGNDLDL